MKERGGPFLILALCALGGGCDQVSTSISELPSNSSNSSSGTSKAPPTANDSNGQPSTPQLLLIQQRVLHDASGAVSGYNTPAYFVGNAKKYPAHFDKLPFNGVVLWTRSGNELFNGERHTFDINNNEWTVLKDFRHSKIKRIFANVNITSADDGRPPDFYDDVGWENTIESFKNYARILRAAGVRGISFDNEDYRRNQSIALWKYPGDCRYPNRSLQDYQNQARARGFQLMKAMTEVYPDIEMLVLFSVAQSFSHTPPATEPWARDPRDLRGAFFVGLLEASNKPLIDGNESAYMYRSIAEFDESYAYRKNMFSKIMNSLPSFVSKATALAWPQKISVSNGIYNECIYYPNANDSGCARSGMRATSPSILRQMLQLSFRFSDEYTWLYWEGGDWFLPGAISREWSDSVVSTVQ